MGALIAVVLAFYCGGVACAVQWGFVLEDEDGNEIDGAEKMNLRLRLALTWFWSRRRIG